jgi:hypothetical protein
MRLVSPTPRHLTYCTNVHAGESGRDVIDAVRGPASAVARKVGRGTPFGLGLRVSARAARELREPDARDALTDALRSANAYVFTVNGFSYGPFHGRPVKERVYRPDWREDERVAYTCELAELLASLLPEDVVGSISTVPGAFAARARTPADVDAIVHRLLAAAVHLVDVERRTGRAIALALEPEPACLLERACDAASFFREHLFARGARRRFAASTRTDEPMAEALLRRHLAVCLDACHVAVGFEAPRAALASLAAEGVSVAKLQVSAAIEVEGASAARAALPALDDGVYLHQTNIAAPDGEMRSYVDLPDALRDAREGLWRVHAHVPIDRDPPRPLATTRRHLEALLHEVIAREATSQLEVETYTWSVLPRELRGEDVVEDIARELFWTRAILEGS